MAIIVTLTVIAAARHYSGHESVMMCCPRCISESMTRVHDLEFASIAVETENPGRYSACAVCSRNLQAALSRRDLNQF